jgi:phosphatidyl-myo-inositol alpha-mannosyltransferase
MRILLACPYAWDVAGGVQTHVRELASALAARGHAVTVVTPARAPRLPPGDHGAWSVHAVGRGVPIRWGGSVARLCPSPGSLRRIRRVLASFRPDVVHVHEPLVPSTSMLTTLAAEAPVVATFHAFTEHSRVERTTAPLLRLIGRRIAVPIAVSASAARHAGHVVRAPFEIVPNGVRIGRFANAPLRARRDAGDRRVLWVHRLEPRKGFAIALAAFTQLAMTVGDVELVVIGDGPDRGALSRVPADVRRRIRMLGVVSDSELPRQHAAADVFVAAALGKESFGLALLEAMAASLPVVASDIAGFRDVVRAGVDGLLVPPCDPGALADALRRVLGDPVLAAALGRGGRERARAFSWDVVVPRLEALYLSARRRNASHATTSSATSSNASSP